MKLMNYIQKRYFRCDCGNSKLKDQPCKLYPNKDPENILNKYDDNFRGLYCICKRPYPDKESPNEDTMLQCVMCEDWLHSEHLGVSIPAEEQDTGESDIICQSCIKKHPFLRFYDESKQNPATTTLTNALAADNNNAPCLLEQAKANNDQQPTLNAILLREGWRKRLCRCQQCLKMYDDLNLSQIFDEADGIQEYERQGFEKSENLDPDKLLANSLQKMDFVQKMEVLYGINEFKESLAEFLRGKANGVVTTTDVQAFFSDLQEKRKKT